jgi:UDP-2,3-diacylglucosamine pyrophosphatase LpxH
MADHLPHYAELYVVSDIHMGGKKDSNVDFQIFNKGERLAGLIRSLVDHRPADDIAFVLNGDIIDSLAEEEVTGYVALDSNLAVRVMERIYADESFAPVWQALSKFVTTPKRHIVFVVGNHDIELALPPVEASLRQHLAGNDPDAQCRLRFATHGGGFGCRVGSARVFCTHGNEVDEWNKVDFDQMGLLANAMNAGREVDARRWKPNAGTRMVVDVMNKFKRRYPFIDLLKPEATAAVGILLTIDSHALSRLNLLDTLPVMRGKWRGHQAVSDLLSASDQVEDDDFAPEPITPDSLADRLLGANLAEVIRTSDSVDIETSEEAMLSAAEDAWEQEMTASEMLGRSGETDTLGWGDIVYGKLGLVGKVEALRRALTDWLKDDNTFGVDTEDSTFEEIVSRVGPEIDIIVTGHTHLARAIELGPKRYYFNCGTWIRLLRLSLGSLNDEETFKPVYDVFGSGKMADLDEAKIPGKGGRQQPLVFDRTNVLKISSNNGRTTAELQRVTDSPGGGVKLETEPKTRTYEV